METDRFRVGELRSGVESRGRQSGGARVQLKTHQAGEFFHWGEGGLLFSSALLWIGRGTPVPGNPTGAVPSADGSAGLTQRRTQETSGPSVAARRRPFQFPRETRSTGCPRPLRTRTPVLRWRLHFAISLTGRWLCCACPETLTFLPREVLKHRGSGVCLRRRGAGWAAACWCGPVCARGSPTQREGPSPRASCSHMWSRPMTVSSGA